MKIECRLFFAIALVLVSSLALAQSNNQTITGTVTDASGAVLPGVSITVVNEGTGLTRTAVTNESGNYSVPQIPIGNYRVEAELPGFRKEVRRGLTLQVDQRARIDLQLQVGQVTEVIEVTGQAPLIQTEDASIGSVIDHQKVIELPLNGRNFESLVQLVPGSVTANQGSHLAGRGGFVIAGQDEHNQSFFVDGVDNVDTIVRNFAYRPSIDAIEEFKVQSSGYSAEFGRNSGAVINVTTKSGTNEFHGAAWDYHRNSALDARDFFDPGPNIPGFIRNQFGATFGGRIIRDKTFFFTAFEGTRERRAITRAGRVPSLELRQGNFSSITTPIRDPLTGQAFAGNIIPRARFDRLAAEVLPFWPEPNRAGALNLVTTPSAINNHNNISVKIDHQITASHRLSSRYSYANEYIFGPFGGETDAGRRLPNFGQFNPRYRTSAGFNITSLLTNSMVNEFRFGFNRFEQPLTTDIGDLAARVGLDPKPLPPIMATIKRNRDAVDTFNLAGNVEPLGAGGGFWRLNNTFNGINNLTITRGNHTIKIGGDARRMLFYNITGAPNTYFFDGRYSGHPFADFLLGSPFRTQTQVGPPGQRAREYGHEGKWDWSIYFQDDWKVSSRLTLNWGVRYEYYVPLTAFNGLSGFDRETGKIQVICVEKFRAECGLPLDTRFYITQNGAGPFPIGMHEVDKNNLAPRIGFAFRPFNSDKSVIRGGYGLYYDSDDRQKSFSHVKNAPFNATLTFDSPAGQPPQIQLTSNPFPTQLGQSGVITSGAIDRKLRNTYSQQWNLGVQHELVTNLLVDVGYQGSLTLKGPRSVQINQPITPATGSVASRRPHPLFGPLGFTENSGTSNFHSLQSKIEQRFSGGLTFISSFMWAKAIDDRYVGGQGNPGNAQNAYNLRAERGLSAFDVRKKWTFSFVYELPVGPGKGRLEQGAAAHILGGWQLSGIYTAQDGRPFTPVLSTDNSNVGIGADRPNLIGNPKVDNPTPQRWFNAAAFAAAPRFTYGSAGRGILTSDGLATLDLSLTKNIRISETMRMQFKGEFFNVTNHTNFGIPENRIDQPSAGTISSTITTSRQIQLGLRIVY